MTRISMLQDGTWYTLKVRGVYTQPAEKDEVKAKVDGKHTAFAHDDDIPDILAHMERAGMVVKSRTH